MTTNNTAFIEQANASKKIKTPPPHKKNWISIATAHLAHLLLPLSHKPTQRQKQKSHFFHRTD